jgi:hypothetical protein
MGTGLSVNVKQMLFVLFILLILLVTAVIVIQAATPHLFHALAFRPNVFSRH